MKRRDFILGATSSAGILLLDGANAATPCSPVLAGGGPGSCSATDAEADWLARISAPGVVWFHDFRSEAEVNAFRWVGGLGNDPNDTMRPNQCNRTTTDGITGGGCLELIYRTDTLHGPGWWRPFGPMNAASTGKSTDDPAANGTISLSSWDASNPGENEAFREAYYAHPDYVGVDGWGASEFNGQEFWLQFRIKIDPERYGAGAPTFNTGKLSFLATTQSTLNQEIVQMNYFDRTALWYTNFGAGGALQDGNSHYQPGGPYDPACGTSGGNNGCWKSNAGEWTTWLYHLVPGHDGTRNTLFEAFAARDGDTDYETIFSSLIEINFSRTPNHPFGWNAFQPSNYTNGQATSRQWYQRYDQIIFSHNFIPCPQF